MVAPVWIMFYSLPSEYWDLEILEDLGNTLGKFVKMTYARICVYMDLSKDLPEVIHMSWEDEEWLQTLDYE